MCIHVDSPYDIYAIVRDTQLVHNDEQLVMIYRIEGRAEVDIHDV